MRKEETTIWIMRIGISFRPFMMTTMVTWPFNDVILKWFIRNDIYLYWTPKSWCAVRCRTMAHYAGPCHTVNYHTVPYAEDSSLFQPFLIVADNVHTKNSIGNIIFACLCAERICEKRCCLVCWKRSISSVPMSSNSIEWIWLRRCCPS